jgi:hypothetical protein
MLDQIHDTQSGYWQSTIHRPWYQERVNLVGGEGGNADIIPQGVGEPIVVPTCSK